MTGQDREHLAGNITVHCDKIPMLVN